MEKIPYETVGITHVKHWNFSFT